MAEDRVEGRLDLTPPIACPGAPINPLRASPMGITPLLGRQTHKNHLHGDDYSSPNKGIYKYLSQTENLRITKLTKR